MIFLDFLAAVAGGIAGHQSRRFTAQIASGWRNLAEHGIGLMLVAPFLLIMWLALGGKKEELPRVFAAFCVAGLGVGAGVSFGWLLDNVEWKQ